jgi:syringate O-demethylase/vanillate/3-O-methylgallate O-demethylase
VAFVHPDHAGIENALYIAWGEPDGGSREPNVEGHRQTRVEVTVAVAPHSSQVRKMKNANLVHA